jgi:hypothetical protein
MAVPHLGRKSQRHPQLAHLVLEQVAQGLEQLETQRIGQAAHVVMALDGGGEGKETLHWVRAIEEATRELKGVGATAWFQVDWEGDRFWTLKALHTSGQRFTVRSTYDHRFLVDSRGRHKFRLREVVAELSPRYERVCQVRRRWTRLARRARFEVRTTHVALDMVEAYSNEGLDLPVAVVDVREGGTTPRGEKPLHW